MWSSTLCKGALRKYTARHNQIKRACIKSLASRPELNVESEPDLRGVNPNQHPDLDPDPDPDPNPNRNGPNGPGSLITTPIRSGARTYRNGLRADFAVINGISKYYYDVQIVAINKIPLIRARLLR
ncbi:hypothetical protein MGG_15980 [Pyricularia oryzae 70-15]|uniref:Uncharacterized protein n=1 Tax=Pyricularia oryzae (strain 70-15 / ATCC MYA-4617 / FGSC 8958) TaxID=242507 RepID=G4MXX3_PYRO7|nr:uncharacterized protein MGG_15980 [Pyricularia oryzae 70-15]EHA56063.1 hypothetical protein MGG_15980 [Pyricularia oryzae 70-15]